MLKSCDKHGIGYQYIATDCPLCRIDLRKIAVENARTEFSSKQFSPAEIAGHYGETVISAERRKNDEMNRRIVMTFQSLSCEVACVMTDKSDDLVFGVACQEGRHGSCGKGWGFGIDCDCSCHS